MLLSAAMQCDGGLGKRWEMGSAFVLNPSSSRSAVAGASNIGPRFRPPPSLKLFGTPFCSHIHIPDVSRFESPSLWGIDLQYVLSTLSSNGVSRVSTNRTPAFRVQPLGRRLFHLQSRAATPPSAYQIRGSRQPYTPSPPGITKYCM